MTENEYENAPNMSRSEDIIQSILDDTEYNEEARSRIEYLLIELKNAIKSGAGGFAPTQAQLDAMNSGINTTKVAQIEINAMDISDEHDKTVGMSAGGTDYITVNGIRVYVSVTQPTGARTGDLWIGG